MTLVRIDRITIDDILQTSTIKLTPFFLLYPMAGPVRGFSMSTRFSIDASVIPTDTRDRTLPPKASSSLPEPLQTHATINYKDYKAGRSPLGKTAFCEEALSYFLSRENVAASGVRRPALFEAIDDWLNSRKL